MKKQVLEEGVAGSLQDVAHEAGWKSANHPGQWVPITRTFRDGSTQQWWALEIVSGPYGPDKTERAVVATTDPEGLPDLTTWYLVTNLPAPSACPLTQQPFAQASLEEMIRLYGLRMWVEQSYKQVKHALGWSQYQVRSDQAIRRHWQLVYCAFSFCWYHTGHASSSTLPATLEQPEQPLPPLLSACLISLGADSGSSSKAPSDRCPSSRVRGKPTAWIARLIAQLPTTGNSRLACIRCRLSCRLVNRS